MNEYNDFLIDSCIFGKINDVKYAIKNGADINYKNDSAIRYAYVNFCDDIVIYLINNGANIHFDDDKLLKYAVNYRLFYLFKLLIDKKANENIDDKFIVDTLIVNNDFEMLEYFIVSGADVNLINDINIKNKINISLRKSKLNKIYEN